MARPLVAGEDPGRLGAPEATSGQILNLLWLIVALAAAGWFALSGRPLRLGGLVAAGLLVVAALIGLSASGVDCYKNPARLISCEWMLLPIIFMLVTALLADEDPATDSAGGLLAALFASGASVAAFTLYQALASAARWRSPDLPIDVAPPVPPSDDFLGPLATSGLDWIARGTLERSDTLVGLLLLLLPAVAGFARRERAPKKGFAWGIAAVMLVAVVLAGRDFLTRDCLHRIGDGWTTAGRMIGETPSLGVGPGNFERHSPRLQPVDVPYVQSEPRGCYAELAATCGVPALLLLVGTTALVFWSANRGRNAPEVGDGSTETSQTDERVPRWEFYLGGAFGLVLGLGLRVNDLPGAEAPKAILQAGGGAVGRALVWFLAFALFERGLWTTTSRRKALLWGVALVMLFGLVSGALLRPALLQTLWIVAALALAGPTGPHLSLTWRRVSWLLVPPLLAASIGYLIYVCIPAVRVAGSMRMAHMAGRTYGDLQYDIEVAPRPEKPLKRQVAIHHLTEKILKPLRDAVNAEPRNAAHQLEFAAWYRAFWKMMPNSNPAPTFGRLETAEQLDPQGTGPLLRELQLRLTVATLDPLGFANLNDKERKHLTELRDGVLDRATQLVPLIIERDPALEARLRFRLAETLFEVKEEKWQDKAMGEARRARELDEAAPGPRWRLTKDQRTQLEKWLKPKE